MTVNELMKLLQDLDEDGQGDLEVVIDNQPITLVTRLPGFYDGCYWRVCNKKGEGGFPRIEICANKAKLLIQAHREGPAMFVEDNPNTEVYYDSEYTFDHWDRYIEKARLKGMIYEVNNMREEWDD